MARQVVVEVVGNADSFNSATRGAVQNANGLSGSLKGSAVAGAAAGVALSGVNMAIGFVTDALSGASEAAKEDTASQDRLALALENTGRQQALSTEQIEAAISANQAKGVSDSDQRAGIAAFLDMTKDATKAMELNQAVIELASAKDISYADAQAMVVSATAGKTAALAKAGVEIEKGASATEIAAAINDKFAGSLDAAANTQGGKSRIASEKMGEAMEKLGRVVNKVAEVVMPAVADAVSWVVDNVLPPLGRAFTVLAPIVGGAFGTIGKVIGTFVTLVTGVVDIVRDVARSIGRIFDTMADVISRVFGGIVGVVKAPINAVIGLINGVIRGINSISFTTPDWLPGDPVTFSPNLPTIPNFHAGGIVPGTPGATVPAFLQAGERVIPLSGAGSGAGMVINLTVLAGVGDPVAIGAEVVAVLRAYERNAGTDWRRSS